LCAVLVADYHLRMHPSRDKLAIVVLGLVACGPPDVPAEEAAPDLPHIPQQAAAYMQERCAGGDDESCEVMEVLAVAEARCAAGEEEGCWVLSEIVEALEDLEAVLEEQRCMDPCSELCIEQCASADEGQTGACVDTCMRECLDAGC
jgi:hypothetical protein